MDSRSARDAPTIDDVARAAGVSTATVSRCLNSPDKVQKQTRERVLQAVGMLGYTPNFGARVMAARRTNTIGAVIPTMDNAIFARGLQAFQETLHDEGLTLLVATSQYDPAQEEEQIRTLLARGADGLLLIGTDRSATMTAELAQRQVPTVISWAIGAEAPAACVGFDNARAMQDLTEAVLDFGHRRLASVSAHLAGNDRARARVSGIHAAMSAAGLDPASLDLIQTDYSIEAGRRAMARLMAGPDAPTAVLCGNDVLAVGAVQEAQRLGLRVPGDVSVTGFDDIELARITNPGLCTVHVPHRDMGRHAARTLMEMIRKGAPPTALELKTGLRLRGSLGPAPGA